MGGLLRVATVEIRGEKNMNNKMSAGAVLLLLVAMFEVLVVGRANATEGGGSSYPMGADNYMSGYLPPPGIYGQIYAQNYEADSLRDDGGKSLPVDFRARVDALVPRVIWVPGQELLGGGLALHVIAPIVDMAVKLNDRSEDKEGLGDMTFGVGLGYHYSQKFHVIYGLDVIAPTGSYDRNDLANLGRNYWAAQPVVAISHIDPNGLNLDAKIMYDFNSKNPDTDYRSGQEFHADYAVGWGLGDGWVVGVGGYVYRQATDDRLDGNRVQDNKGRVFAFGPSIKYGGSGGWFVTAKWQGESEVRNRAEGSAYWLKLVVPL